MKKFLQFLFLILAFSSGAAAQSPTVPWTHNFTANGSSVCIPLVSTGVTYHQIKWYPTGTVSTGNLKLEKSLASDCSTPSDLIANQTATSPGRSAVTTDNANYVRMTVSSLTGGGTIRAVYLGWMVEPTVVDTELAAAVTITDNIAYPTVPLVGAVLLCDDGTNLDKCRTSAGGIGPSNSDTARVVTADDDPNLQELDDGLSDLDTGAGTVNRVSFGLLGAASGGPVAIQGTAADGLEVDVTRVQGTVTVTATNLDVQIGGSDSLTIGTFPDNEPFNLNQLAGNAISSGVGASGTGTLRVAALIHDGVDTADVTAAGEVEVFCGNCSGSGAVHIDNNAFTGGTDDVAPAGFLYDTTPPAITDGNAGIARMDSNRYVLVNCAVGCAGGVTDTDDGTIAGAQVLSLNIVENYVWDGTNWIRQAIYAEDTPTAAGEQIVMSGVVRQDTLVSLVGADQDRTVLSVDNLGAVYSIGYNRAGTDTTLDSANDRASVALYGQSGASISFATGTSPTFTVTAQCSYDNAASWETAFFITPSSLAWATTVVNPSAVERIIQCAQGATHAAAEVTSFTSGSTTATVRATSVMPTVVSVLNRDSTGTEVPVMQAGAGVITSTTPRVNIATDDPVNDALVNLDLALVVEDVAETADNQLLGIGTVRRDTAASSAGTTGDNATLNTDANGRLWARAILDANSGVDIGDVDVTSLPNEGQQTAANSISVTPDTDNDPIGATGAAVPGEAVYQGGTDGTNLTPYYVDPCEREARTVYRVDIATGGTPVEVAAAVASEFYYICSINLVTAAANNVIIVEDDTATNCPSITAGVSSGGTTAAEGWNFAANGGIVIGNGQKWVMKTTTANRSFCILPSASTQLSGTITYVSAP